MSGATIVWFRQDLRLADNGALASAVARRMPIVPVYVLDEAAEGRWAMGAAAKWWLHHSLAALDAALRARGSRLLLVRGDAATVLTDLARRIGAGAIVWNRRYEPAAVDQARRVRDALAGHGRETEEHAGALLFEPASVRNRQGGPFQVFTPFWRHCGALPVPAPVKLRPGELPAPARWPASLALADLELLPRIRWDRGLAELWTPGEEAARKRLRSFVSEAMDRYAEQRDIPAVEGTSLLSPHLRFGEITPRQVHAAIVGAAAGTGAFPPNRGAAVFWSEVGWREFGYHLLTHFPHTTDQPLREAFARFPWASDADGARWRAWTRGMTGYPIVDAGMRQLWRTGWMHNRVRMVVASFLVKHLRLPWTRGAEWFWDTLVDSDLASNTLGWQWSAGCGADAAPYFRIFAPVAQGERFDPEGTYVRRWVPELAQLPAKHIHAPWTAPSGVLEAAGIRLGEDYPAPIVEHGRARAEALAAFAALKQKGSA